MKLLLALCLLPVALAPLAARPASDWMAVKARAEDLYARGSFEAARRAYLEVDATTLSPEDRRWLEFRSSDTRWRSAAGAQNADSTEIDLGRKGLEELQRKVERLEERDRTWALVEESLGDWSWQRQGGRDYSQAFPHYQQALAWWSGARDVEAARKHYLEIAFRMGWPDGGKGDNGWWYGQVPLAVAQNAVKVAVGENDKAQALFMLATVLRNQGGDYDARARMFEALRSAVALEHDARFRDDALFRLAQAIEQNGEPKLAEDGSWTSTPDYSEALALYRQLQEEYAKGDTAWWDEAREGIRRIVRTELNVAVPSAFLPGSEIGYALSWRNAARVDLALYAIDLTRNVDLSGKDRSWSSWLETVDTATLSMRAGWTHDTEDDGRHVPAQRELRLEPTLPPGAYLLEARAGDARSRELVLVSATSLVLKAVGDRALVWCCDALTSVPEAGVQVRLFTRSWKNGAWSWTRAEKISSEDGLVSFDVDAGSSHELFAVARKGERQAFAGGGSYDNAGPGGSWRIYAFTDRSTYRPNDEVSWKILARRGDGGAWTTPKGQKLSFEVFDPRGASFQKGDVKLSDFGSAHGTFEPGGNAALGEYRIVFANAGQSVGQATLFRLEEYKLPEYEVRVRPATDDGRTKLFVVGDRVDVDIEAAFYAGGPVTDADVEVVVRQNTYWRRWAEAHEYAWYYEDKQEEWRWSGYRGGGQVVKQEKLKTDAKGHARIAFDTPRDLGQDFEYTIEARVTDASRREISGSGSVRVTRREYDVRTTSARNLQRVGESAVFTFEAQDANQGPVAADGSVRVTRERWVEVWIDPSGREVSGTELDALREPGLPFPPPPARPSDRPWRWKSAGYAGLEIAKSALKLDATGHGTFTFIPPREGYYRVRFTSKDGRGRPVESETWTWCLSPDTRELGYQSNGLEIVVDKDTFRCGEKAPVMITTRSSNRWVLLTIESAKLHSCQVVHVEGTAKLLMLDVTDVHVPNIWIAGVTVAGGEASSDAKAVVVPPLDQFLDVKIHCDRDPVLPGSKAMLEVQAKNARGEPVSVELALALVDESVASIQGDFAGDVRQFFYGERKQLLVQTHTSFDQRNYRKYRLDDKGRVVDERVVLGRFEGVEWLSDQAESKDELAGALRQETKEEAGFGKRRGGDGERMAKNLAGFGRAPSGAPAQSAEALDLDDRASQFGGKDASAAVGGGGVPEIQVRSDFRETALWSPALVTGPDGRAEVEVQFPDSLTRWKASARAIDVEARVGTASSTVRAQKPLVARLQAPRFFTVGDETIVSGVIDNRTDAAMTAHIELAIDGPLERESNVAPDLVIPAQGEVRVDWKTHAVKPGDVRITLSARSATDSDALVRKYPVQDHGVEVQIARSMKLKDGELTALIDIPAARTRETTRFTVDVAPSLAVTMLDALPYLVDYPYGCTEQTMSRFLPAAIVAHTLRSRGLSPEEAMERVFGGIEPETAGQTHPNARRALDRLDEVTRLSLDRLYDFQHSDGGWGWWKDGESDPWMSAYVVWGLSLARDAQLDVRPEAIARGAQYLSLALVEAERDPDRAAWMLHALAASGAVAGDERADRAFAKLWEQKQSLRAYGKALFALAAQAMKRNDEARVLCENLANGVQIDAHPDQSRIGAAGQGAHEAALGTARWGSDAGWWRWQDGAIETTAFALRALSVIDPKNPLVEQASNWLVQNRRGAQWNNTRDTAISILALDSFLNATGEMARDVEYELFVNGEPIATKKLAAAEMLTVPAHFVVPADKVKNGVNEVRLKRISGSGPLYLAARAVFFSREDPIRARGSDLFVRRQYWKLVPRETLLAGVVYDRIPLDDGGSVVSGERVEVVLTLELKNDFEYLMFEDMKPAGLEAAEIRSGDGATAREIKSGEVARRFGSANAIANAPDDSDGARFTGRQRTIHQELRDSRVALFLDRLSQGVWEVRYELRAEVPGRFSALPTLGSAMYVPEVSCNGDEVKLTVVDRGVRDD